MVKPEVVSHIANFLERNAMHIRRITFDNLKPEMFTVSVQAPRDVASDLFRFVRSWNNAKRGIDAGITLDKPSAQPYRHGEVEIIRGKYTDGTDGFNINMYSIGEPHPLHIALRKEILKREALRRKVPSEIDA